MGSPRVDLSPITVAIEEGATTHVVVFGGRLRAFTFGPTPPATPGPVELIFSGDYLTKARKGELSPIGEFAKLPAELVVTDTGAEIHVTADATLPVEQLVEIADQDHPVVGKIPPLSLTLELGVGFQVLQSDSLPVRGRLLIPPPAQPSKYLEIAVSIKRDGVEVAPAAVSGRLDVSLLLLDFLVFQVKDEQGKLAADVDVEIELTNGDHISGKTDQDGRFAINGVPRGECGVLLPLGIQIKDQPKANATKPS